MNIRYGRKRSGIEKELNKKIKGWIASIDDESVADLAKRDTIVTGGAIASMLLGEPVNDFDVYFRTQETTVAVARYYAKRCGLEQGAVSVSSVENIRGQLEDRVQIYIGDTGKAKENGKSEYRVKFMSENAITLSGKIQIITRFYGEPGAIHENYDFAHAQCYWDHQHKILDLPAQALECMLSRTLVYTGGLYPIASIFRVKKFLERGWRISAGELLKIMWQISEVNMSNIRVLMDQLTGVDVTYMRRLVRALGDMRQEDIDSEVVVSLIEDIFNGRTED